VVAKLSIPPGKKRKNTQEKTLRTRKGIDLAIRANVKIVVGAGGVFDV
jgi:hypothetical protein